MHHFAALTNGYTKRTIEITQKDYFFELVITYTWTDNHSVLTIQEN